MPHRTWKQAKDDLLVHLASRGWEVSSPYNQQMQPRKIMYATHPTGTVRLWFKPQAVLYSTAQKAHQHVFSNARSTWRDARAVAPDEFVASVLSAATHHPTS